jgi:hypothetical protein
MEMMMERDFQPEVSQICEKFSSDTDVLVSLRAQTLIAKILNSFLYDPHPKWHIDKKEHEIHLESFLDRLPERLYAIAKVRNHNDPINSFDVLFWLSYNLKEICPWYLCPFD